MGISRNPGKRNTMLLFIHYFYFLVMKGEYPEQCTFVSIMQISSWKEEDN